MASFWYFESALAHPAEAVLPSGKIQLLVDLGAAGTPPIVAGPATRRVVVPAEAMTRIAGVVFEPGGAAPFLGVGCHELRDRDVDLDLLWGPNDLQADLLEAREPRVALARLEAALLARLDPTRRLHRDVSGAIEALQAGATVQAILHDTTVSRTRLVELFRRQLGLTPKQFGGLARFQRVVHALAGGAEDLADLALACGYHAQAHMTHDFRKYGGLTPGRYRRTPTGPNHVPLQGDDFYNP